MNDWKGAKKEAADSSYNWGGNSQANLVLLRRAMIAGIRLCNDCVIGSDDTDSYSEMVLELIEEVKVGVFYEYTC